MEVKKCPICGIIKKIDEYHSYFSKARQKYRIGNYCKPCARKEAKPRATKNYEENKEYRKQYARDYRANEANKGKLKVISAKFKKKYRDELKGCYVRDRLNQDNNIPTSFSLEYPEIVETKRLQLSIRRKLKSIKNGKE